MMRGMGACAALCAVLAIANACGPTAQPKAREDHEEELLGPKIAEDFDEAEQRWRNDIADARWSNDDMNVLTDDPPQTPEAYGKISDPRPSDASASRPQDLDEQGAETKWDRAGKATFSFLSVAATIGMMVAPYFLL